MTLSRRISLSLLLTSAGCVDALSRDGAGGSDTGNTVRAADCPPADLWGSALCLCEDFNEVGMLSVVEGPSGVGQVGVNGHTRFVNQTRAAGDWIAYAGFEAVTDTEISGSLKTEGDASWVGLLKIGVDLAIGGDATGVGLLEVLGSLSVGGDETMLPGSDVGGRAEYVPLDGPPCPCDPDTFFDVAGAVAAARADNDNAAAGLPTRLAAIGVNDLRLESGTYYFEDAATVGSTHITIAGQVGLYVEGTIAAVGQQNITVEDGGALDLFVSGSIATVGWTTASGDPDAVRVYIGGSDQVMLASVGVEELHANIYAPEAMIAYVGDTTLVGSLFGRVLHGVGVLEIGYGAPAEVDPPACEDPDGDSDPDPESDPETDPESDPDTDDGVD